MFTRTPPTCFPEWFPRTVHSLLTSAILICQECGDGIVQGSEGCDDGNTDAGDGCNAMCLIEDGNACTFDAGCESGNCENNVCGAPCTSDDDCATGETCNTTTGICEAPPVDCGNDTLNDGEGCDDGNTVAGDGCNARCLIEDGESCRHGHSVCERRLHGRRVRHRVHEQQSMR
ncbi:MAG: DUF4215 domain-containing protein [Polyangiales bacterium]